MWKRWMSWERERKKCGEEGEIKARSFEQAKDEGFHHLHPPVVYLECQAKALFIHSITPSVGPSNWSLSVCVTARSRQKAMMSFIKTRD
jgi:hypothetical protein